MEIRDSITQLKGVGTKTADLFAKLHIYSIENLIHFYPRDYESFEEPTSIVNTMTGEVCSVYATVQGSLKQKKIRNLIISTGIISDGTGRISITYFNMPFLRNVLVPGCSYIFRGMLQGKGTAEDGSRILVMEQSKIYKPEEYHKLTGFLQPRYPLTAGLTNHTVSKSMKQALELLDTSPDFLPKSICNEHNLIPNHEALMQIHFPASYEQMCEAHRRLAFDEFFSFMIAMQCMKGYTRLLPNAFPMLETAGVNRLLEEIPFTLTKAQKKVWQEIEQDLTGEAIMNRLIQGDVGSGKTIIAFLALLLCVSNGYQGAMMAPTEILAAQHMETISNMIHAYQLPFRPILLTGSLSAKAKRDACEKIVTGAANLVIGTHALIQEKISYQNLALVVTDEQHRFGVRQREALAGKGRNVHVMVMSATPIPRTLAIILYGDLDISIIDELPANRLPVKNCVVGTAYRPKAYAFLQKEITQGHQVYVICPMVEEGEMDGVENVVDYTEKLKSELPSQIQISYLHGKMKASEKQAVMEAFEHHDIDILVSTTVIEVGINVPNSTVMMVENAERFGLAQLHQLRGRVGRGSAQSYCIFVCGSDKKEAIQRLEILNKSNDGFMIAEEDLKLRGPGDLFGIRQSGELNFKIADIYQDAGLLKTASMEAGKLLQEDPELVLPEHLALADHLRQGGENLVDFRTI